MFLNCFLSFPVVLTFFDTMVVVFVIFLKGGPSMDETFLFHINILPICHPLMNIFWFMSVYLIVFITLERFYAVCGSGTIDLNRRKINVYLGKNQSRYEYRINAYLNILKPRIINSLILAIIVT